MSRMVTFNYALAAAGFVVWFWQVAQQPSGSISPAQGGLLVIGPFSIALKASRHEQERTPAWSELVAWAAVILGASTYLPRAAGPVSAWAVGTLAVSWLVLQWRLTIIATEGDRPGFEARRTWTGAPRWRIALPVLCAGTAWSLSLTTTSASFYVAIICLAVWTFSHVPPRPPQGSLD